MSDVSKTNELIIEARQHYSEMNGLNSRAAEVMMELVAALEVKTGVRVDMSSAVGVETQLATRVPVQGEPNDDREALEAEHDGLEALYASGEISFAVALDRARAVGAALAAVPDAATKRAERAEAARDRWELLSGEGVEKQIVLRAERDAALVAAQGAAPVLPSSGVDEGKLADVMDNLLRESWDGNGYHLDGGTIARAVVEAIGGESR